MIKRRVTSKINTKTFVLNGKLQHSKEYVFWRGMMRRVFSESYHETRPSYRTCTISEKFLDFDQFVEWCRYQIGFYEEDYHLDKDIILEGNKHYSENTCVFVPSWLNMFFVKNDARRGEYPLGVSMHKKESLSKRFQARVQIYDLSTKKSKQKHLGYFKTPEEAFLAYKKAKELIAKEYAENLVGKVDDRVIERLKNYSVPI